MTKRGRKIDFPRVAEAAARHAPSILSQWLPNSRKEGREFVALNPKRPDRHLGSLKINMNTTCWSDFSVGAKGGDLISLAAYLFDLNQREAAENIGRMLGIDVYES